MCKTVGEAGVQSLKQTFLLEERNVQVCTHEVILFRYLHFSNVLNLKIPHLYYKCYIYTIEVMEAFLVVIENIYFKVIEETDLF